MESPMVRNTSAKGSGRRLTLQVGSTLPADPGAACTAAHRIWRLTTPVNPTYPGNARDDWTPLHHWLIVRGMRLKSSIWVATYLRRC